MRELPTPVRAAPVKAEQPEAQQKKSAGRSFADPGSEKKAYEPVSAASPEHPDDLVEQSGLNSSLVLATLFDLQILGMVRQSPGSNSVRCCYNGTYGANHLPLILHLKPESIPKADSSI
jgi:hypothetical protein